MKLTKIIAVFFLVLGINYCIGVYTPQQEDWEKIYNNFASFKEYQMSFLEKKEPVYIIAVGDIMLSRYVAQIINEHDNPNYPFLQVKSLLQRGDIVFGNLEGPITPGREIKIPEMVFRADPKVAEALKGAGFNILSLANNHMFDFGTQGILDTFHYLDRAGINYTGAGRNVEEAFIHKYIEVKGVKVAFLAFTDPIFVPDSYVAGEKPGVAFFEPEKLTAAVRKAEDEADFTVIYLHGGTEYVLDPDETLRNIAHLAIDAGADLVLGSHPHVVQKVEEYRGKYILYSLGNFIFDQLWSKKTRESIIVRIAIRENKVEKIEFLPVFINNEAVPVPLGGQEGLKIVEKLRLDLYTETKPIWDFTQNSYRNIKQYVFYPNNLPVDYRLVKSQQCDIDDDGITEMFELKKGKLIVRNILGLIWQSPENWWVDYFFLGDINNDGIQEINLLVWKEGSFGPCKPFWLKEEDTSVKNHLFIFKLEKDKIKPVWQSSNLDCPNYYANIVDLNNDGENELLVIEGSYINPSWKRTTLWQWNGWGFIRII